AALRSVTFHSFFERYTEPFEVFKDVWRSISTHAMCLWLELSERFQFLLP
uniref:F-box domain-containing protein n=1 Tax=Parascaris univalens TaxID=6257 RepID=A0A915C4K9_PARUN